MSGSSVGLILQDTDHGNNDADDCHYNTCDSDSKPIVKYTMYLSLYFPSVPPPLILEVLRMYSFWRRRTATRFGNTCHYYNIFVYFANGFVDNG